MLASASKMGLLRHCQWWARPDAIAPVQAPSASAQRGTDRHRVMEWLVTGEQVTPAQMASLWDCALEEWPAVEANLRAWLPSDGQTEQAMYYSPSRCVARGARLTGAREYELQGDEIPGTLDFSRGWPVVEVWDYKTGRQDNLEPIATNAQLAFLAMVRARLVDARGAVVVLACVADDGTAEITCSEYDSLELDEIADELKVLAARIPTAEPNPGGWCEEKWCPCRAVCPAMTQAIATTPAAALTFEIHDAETCARVHTQLALAEEFLEQVKRARNAFLEGVAPGGVTLPDGSLLVWAEESRETIQANNAARAYLVEHGLDGAIEYASSKTALERVIKSQPGEGTIKERIAAVMQDLASMGAVKVTTYNRPKVKKTRAK